MMNIDLRKCTVEEFIKYFKELNGISTIWNRILKLVSEIDPEVRKYPEVLKILVILFSLLDDGNICIALDKEILLKKILLKLRGLHLVIQSEKTELDSAEIANKENDELEDVISRGILIIQKGELKKLFHYQSSLEKTANDNTPFVVANINGLDWLFVEKYYSAKIVIEDRISKIFAKKEVSTYSKIEEIGIREQFSNITRNNNGKSFNLNDRQLEAVIRGQKENLFITGGPGTGKTTVVCFLLWMILKNETYKDSRIYLAAPSGKAADRLHESINEILGNIISEERLKNIEVFEKLNSLQSHTIHKLLNYNPENNKFRYDEKNQFGQDSIFIIDEASMIDIILFKSLLSAIPDDARVFILGDKDQLPSVQAGGVLGDLLIGKKDSLVQLIQSNRFKDDSEVGILSKAIQTQDEECKTHWEEWNNSEDFSFKDASGALIKNDSMPVFYYKADDKQIEQIALKWDKEYYSQLSSLCKNLNGDENSIGSKLDEIWKNASFARILCAERRGKRGVDFINQQIHNRHVSNESLSGEYYAPGELVMITKNQTLFNLYNGDSGVVVSFGDVNRLFLMLQKSVEMSSDNRSSKSNENGIFSINSYIFYPLDILPMDSLELSYSITVHKAQGSGYNSILLILPNQIGHPLLNRQILYTGVTRTKGKTFIVSSEENFTAAKNTVIQRDTMINL